MSKITIYEQGRNGWGRKWYPTHGEKDLTPNEMTEIREGAAITGSRKGSTVTLQAKGGLEKSFEISPLYGDREVDERTAKRARELFPDLDEIVVVLLPPNSS